VHGIRSAFPTQLERSDDNTRENMTNTSLPLKAFKRATSVELSKWFPGSPTTNLAESQDTDAAFVGAGPLRHALRALASEPDFLRAPHEAIARLRPQVYAARRRVAQDFESGGPLDEQLRCWTRLADGAVIGLSYLARMSVDVEAPSVVAPFAVMAVGEYGARHCGPDSIFELQYVLPEDQRSWERSHRIVAFIRIGLTELGLTDYRDAVGTANACACVARADPTAAARFATARFLTGQYGLYAGFAGGAGRVATYPTLCSSPWSALLCRTSWARFSSSMR
jgi:hypothetical protein